MAKAGGKQSPEITSNNGFEPDLKCESKPVRMSTTASEENACEYNYELSNQVITDKGSVNPIDKKAPQEQTNVEWWADYENASV